jgi:hypothetical protein
MKQSVLSLSLMEKWVGLESVASYPKVAFETQVGPNCGGN